MKKDGRRELEISKEIMNIRTIRKKIKSVTNVKKKLPKPGLACVCS